MIFFHPNCTFPSSHPSGFVGATNIRTTMEIVWSCISVTILSTWSVLHLNVPLHRPRAEGILENIGRSLSSLFYKLGWMIVMLLFPEYFTILSTKKLALSYLNKIPLQKKADKEKVPWSLQHTILADMGGIAIRFHEPQNLSDVPGQEVLAEAAVSMGQLTANAGNLETQTLQRSNVYEVQRTASNEDGQEKPNEKAILMEQSTLDAGSLEAQAPPPSKVSTVPDVNKIAPSARNTCRLDSYFLALAREHHLIESMPRIEHEEIAARNKADGLVRFLALLQVVWLVAQLITRKHLQLPTTTLEINTVAFASSAFCLYLLEWEKPKDVGVPIYINARPGVSYETFASIIAPHGNKTTSLETRRYYISHKKMCKRLPDSTSNLDPGNIQGLVALFSVPLFGAVHLFAWNYVFPTPAEHLLWKISAIITIAAPFGYCILAYIVQGFLNDSKSQETLNAAIALISVSVYFAARIFLIMESFRSLYFLPSENFKSTWAANAPHLG